MLKSGLRSSAANLDLLRRELKSTFETVGAQLAHAQSSQANLLSQELGYLAGQVETQTHDIVGALQLTCDYLGTALTEIRWAIERNAAATQKLLLESLTNGSRQYFEQGVTCYEEGEFAFARDRFSLALERNRTNFFAYQHLGFLARKEPTALLPFVISNWR